MTTFRILVIDDDRMMRNSLVDLIEARGWTAKPLARAVEAERWIDQFQPDVILSDVRMPEMSGMELLESLDGVAAPPIVLISAHGDIPAGACVAMHSGWSGKVGGDGFRNADAEGKQHYPGFHPEATQMLIEGGAAGSIAVDTLSLDHGASTTFDVHYQWLPSGRFGIENIANLDKVPAAGATLVVGAPKIRGGTGGPARIFAMV